MTKGAILSVVAMSMFGLEACNRPAAGPVQRPTLAEIRNTSVSSLRGTENEITLNGGRWEGQTVADGSSSHPVVELLEDILLAGDVDGNGSEDAVVFLAGYDGTVGPFLSMALIVRNGHDLANAATVNIGDRVQVRMASIENGVIVLLLVQHGEEDAMCCPGDLVTRKWTWNGTTLEEQPLKGNGRLSPAILSGEEWKLLAWNSGELAEDSLEITMHFSDGAISVSAGCNSYVAPVSMSDIPGDIRIGPGALTKSGCPPHIRSVEKRLLRILPRVSQFGFLHGDVFFGYMDEEGAPRILLIGKRG